MWSLIEDSWYTSVSKLQEAVESGTILTRIKVIIPTLKDLSQLESVLPFFIPTLENFQIKFFWERHSEKSSEVTSILSRIFEQNWPQLKSLTLNYI